MWERYGFKVRIAFEEFKNKRSRKGKGWGDTEERTETKKGI